MRPHRARHAVNLAVALALAATLAACSSAPDAAEGTGSAVPDAPDAPAEPAAEPVARPQQDLPPSPQPGPEPAPTTEQAPEPSPFTTTSPRGPVEPARWPAEVSITAIDVRAPVLPVGVGTSGALIIPDSPRDVGWYQGGSVPGEPGVALLTSHLDTRREGRGVFAGLVELAVGDEVVLTSADGTTQRWVVTRREQHRKDALPAGLFARAGDAELALVTCGGPFDREARSYRDNVIVWATPAG